MPLLNVDQMTVRFPHPRGTTTVVDSVSFSLEPGKTLALVGESGCGKTMSALAVLRLLPAHAQLSSESLTLAGRDLSRLSAREMTGVRGKEVGMVFQEPLTSFNPLYSVGEQAAEGLRLHEKMSRTAAQQRTLELFKEVGLPDADRLARCYPHQLSGGQRQRAMIAMALACRPSLLIADEPTTALDVSMQAQIIDLMLHLQEHRKIAILLITHDLGVVAEMAHDVAVMYAGQVVERADCKALFAKPRHPYTQALLDSLPRVPEPGQKTQPLAAIPGTVPDPSRFPPGCRFAPRCRHSIDPCRQPQDWSTVAVGHGTRCGRAKEGIV